MHRCTISNLKRRGKKDGQNAPEQNDDERAEEHVLLSEFVFQSVTENAFKDDDGNEGKQHLSNRKYELGRSVFGGRHQIGIERNQ